MHLGRTGERAGRECGLQHIDGGHAVFQRAFDVADDVHHVAVALDGKGFGHLHRAGLGDAPDVVARQVDQHDVLGALLRVVDEFQFGGLVEFRRGAARPRTGQRADGDLLFAVAHAFLPHQDFRRGRDHVEITEVVIEHVGRRVQRTQRAVQRQRRFGVALADALADLHLHEVAACNQLLGLFDGRDVVGLGKGALGRMGLGRLDLRCTDGVLELLLQFAHAPLGVGIGLGLRRIGVDDQVQLARQVVDDGQFLALQQQDVGAAQRVGRAGLFELLLDVANRVVTEVAGQAAAETRQSRSQRHLETLLIGLDEVQRIAFGRFDHPAFRDDFGARLGAETAGTNQRACRQSDEAVAAEALAADHGFQQEAVFAAVLGMRELEVERERGFEVGKGLGHQRNAVIALRAEALEFEFGDHDVILRLPADASVVGGKVIH